MSTTWGAPGAGRQLSSFCAKPYHKNQANRFLAISEREKQRAAQRKQLKITSYHQIHRPAPRRARSSRPGCATPACRAAMPPCLLRNGPDGLDLDGLDLDGPDVGINWFAAVHTYAHPRGHTVNVEPATHLDTVAHPQTRKHRRAGKHQHCCAVDILVNNARPWRASNACWWRACFSFHPVGPRHSGGSSWCDLRADMSLACFGAAAALCPRGWWSGWLGLFCRERAISGPPVPLTSARPAVNAGNIQDHCVSHM